MLSKESIEAILVSINLAKSVEGKVIDLRLEQVFTPWMIEQLNASPFDLDEQRAKELDAWNAKMTSFGTKPA